MSADFTINIIANQSGTPISAASGDSYSGVAGGHSSESNPNGGPHDDLPPVMAAYQNLMELGKSIGAIFHGAQHLNFKLITSGILRMFREMFELSSSVGRIIKDIPGAVTDLSKASADFWKKLFPGNAPVGSNGGAVKPAVHTSPIPTNQQQVQSSPPGQAVTSPQQGPPPLPVPPPLPASGGPVPPPLPAAGGVAGLFANPVGIVVAAVVASLVALVAATTAATIAMLNIQKRAEKETKEYAAFSPKLGEIANRLEMAERMRKAYSAEKLSGPISDVLESKVQFDNAVNKFTTSLESVSYRLLTTLTPMMERLAMFLENISRIMDIIEFYVIRPTTNAVDKSRKGARGVANFLDSLLQYGGGAAGVVKPFGFISDGLIGPGSSNRVSDPFFDELVKSSTGATW